MKSLNNDPKNNFNSKYERGNFLKFFGETLIFFGSILKLIWINENKRIKMKIRKYEKTWTTWSPSLIEVADQVARNYSARGNIGNSNARSRLKQFKSIQRLKTKPAHYRRPKVGRLLRRPWPVWFTHHHKKMKKEDMIWKKKWRRARIWPQF
jgi:hypothetical protein